MPKQIGRCAVGWMVCAAGVFVHLPYASAGERDGTEPAPFTSRADEKPLRKPSSDDNRGPLPNVAKFPGSATPAVLNQPAAAAGRAAPRRKSSALGESDSPAVDIRPASFQQITPGQTRIAALKRQLGAPARETPNGESVTLRYEIGPFSEVAFVVVDDVVRSILIELETGVEAQDVAEELQLTEFRPAAIVDETGQSLGRVYPERGVVFAFDEADDDLTVQQIILDAITAEPFVVRAEQSFPQHQLQLNDLAAAIEIEPRHARAHWLHAKLLAELERSEEARRSVEQALEIAPENSRYMLTHARLLADLGQHEQALEKIRDVAADKSLPALVRARVELQLGDLLADPHNRDFKRALPRHTAAIQLAAPLGNDAQVAVRREARLILVDAHLAIAMDIASGHWQGKKAAVDKWLANAGRIADGMIDQEQQSPLLPIRMDRKSLEAYAALGVGDPAKIAKRLETIAAKLLSDTDDPLLAQRVQWETAAALLAAAQIEQTGEKLQSAAHFARRAVAFIEHEAGGADLAPRRELLLARVCFQLGAAQEAIGDDRADSAAWYSKAAPLLTKHADKLSDFEAASDGQRLINIGIAAWESGQRERALQWTRQGVAQLKRGVESKLVDTQLLAIGIRNLSAMHSAIGDRDQAAALTAEAEQLQGDVRR